MPRGYRYGIAACAGLAALLYVFQLGWFVGVSNYPQEQRYQPYRYAADKPREADPLLVEQAGTQALEMREPCRDPKGQDESDLCAQWKAARASEANVLWAQRTFWLGVVGLAITGLGTGLLLRTIRQSDEALQQARDAVATENRAWVVQNRTGSGPSVSRNGAPLGIVLTINWANVGNSPALNVRTWSSINIVDKGADLNSLELPKNVKQNHGFSVIGQGDYVINSRLLSIPQISKIIKGEKVAIFHSWCEYEDVFKGPPRQSEVAFLVDVVQSLEMIMTANPNVDYVTWKSATAHQVAT